MNRRVWFGQLQLVQENISGDNLDWLKQQKFLKVMDRHACRALHATREAMRQAVPLERGHRGVVTSMAQLASGTNDWSEARVLAKNMTQKDNPAPAEIGNYLSPLALIPRLPNTIAGHLAREFLATGPCWTSGGGDHAGLEAVVQGARWIADGECSQVIVVRVEEDGAMALILDSTSGAGKGREIVSWSVESFEKSAADQSILEIAGVSDWKGWETASELRAGKDSCLRLVFGAL